MDLLKQISDCTTMPELDKLRVEVVVAGRYDEEYFRALQRAFTKKKRQLKIMPYSGKL